MKITCFNLFITFLITSSALAQPEVHPWSNIDGIRVDGELMELNSAFTIIGADWTNVRKTAKERARYNYIRQDRTQITNISIGGFHYDQSVDEIAGGMANVRINFRNEVDTTIIGTFFAL